MQKHLSESVTAFLDAHLVDAGTNVQIIASNGDVISLNVGDDGKVWGKARGVGAMIDPCEVPEPSEAPVEPTEEA